MVAMVFDTFEYAEELKTAGVNEGQIRAQIRALSKALESKDLATKSDISELRNELKNDMSELKIDLIKWMIGSLFAFSGIMFTLLRFMLPS